MKKCTFLDELSTYLDQTTTMTPEVIINGDLNVHINDFPSCQGSSVHKQLNTGGLAHHVTGETRIHVCKRDEADIHEYSPVIQGISLTVDPQL